MPRHNHGSRHARFRGDGLVSVVEVRLLLLVQGVHDVGRPPPCLLSPLRGRHQLTLRLSLRNDCGRVDPRDRDAARDESEHSDPVKPDCSIHEAGATRAAPPGGRLASPLGPRRPEAEADPGRPERSGRPSASQRWAPLGTGRATFTASGSSRPVRSDHARPYDPLNRERVVRRSTHRGHGRSV
jgi:hypothetical protein